VLSCRQVHVGISAHQKLEKLLEVVRLIGFQSLCIFGDCFDEVTLLDPVTYPGAIKQFAKEVRVPACNRSAIAGTPERQHVRHERGLGGGQRILRV
jgi:hypothetical protein